MANLKDIRNRKKSVQSTKKITSAMKMIAAARLRKSQEQVIASRPYADLMSNMLKALIKKADTFEEPPKLLIGTGRDYRHMLIIITSDRGLCGGYNTNVVRATYKRLHELKSQDKPFQIMCIGRKGRDLLVGGGYGEQIVGAYGAIETVSFVHARKIVKELLELFDKGEFDICTVIYNRFISPIQQKITSHQLVPYSAPMTNNIAEQTPTEAATIHSLYEYEPSEKQVLSELMPKNFAVQLFEAMLENIASEQGARMTAMDSATRNANDMIKRLDLYYNRTRQTLVTRELIEIISGAEAL